MLGILYRRCGQVGASIEEVVLNLPEHVENLLAGVPQRNRNPDGGVGFVTVGVCRQTRVIL